MSITRWLQFITKLLRPTRAKRLVGKDHLGNKYFEVERDGRSPRRFVEGNFITEDYKAGDIPTEWEAWIRGSRSIPPTLEEIQRNVQQAKTVRVRAKELEAKDAELQQKEYYEGLVARPQASSISQAGHASAPYFATTERSPNPISTGKDFKPASWQPSQSKANGPNGPASQSPQREQKEDEKETFQPESWTPGKQ